MSDPALLGLPRTFSFEGVDYPTQDHLTRDYTVEAEFVRWVEQQAYLAILRHKDLMGPDDLAEQKAEWRRECAARVYTFSGEYAIRARCSPEGIAELAYLQLYRADCLLREKNRPPAHPPPDREMVERAMKDPEKAGELVDLVLGPRKRKNEKAAGAQTQPPPAPTSTAPSAPSSKNGATAGTPTATSAATTS